MATGYTQFINNKDFDFEKWIKTIIPKAMGFMIDYREDGLDYKDENVLLDGLKSNYDKYHHNGLNSARENLQCIQATGFDWKAVFNAENASILKENALHLSEFKLGKKKHVEVKNAIEKLLKKLQMR